MRVIPSDWTPYQWRKPLPERKPDEQPRDMFTSNGLWKNLVK
jgi:hypothetical protein